MTADLSFSQRGSYSLSIDSHINNLEGILFDGRAAALALRSLAEIEFQQ
jgi:hypothetical protein